MPLELGTALGLRRAVDGSPAQPQDVIDAISRWQRVAREQLAPPARVPQKGGWLTLSKSEVPDGRSALRAELRHPDRDDPELEWIVDVTALFLATRTEVALRLIRENRSRRVRPLEGKPAPPALLKVLIDRQGGLEAFDGPCPIKPVFEMLERDGVAGFIETRLLAPDRHLPIVGIAIERRRDDGRFPFDARGLAQSLVGLAHVVVVRDRANEQLAERLPGLSVPEGGARIWWPGLEVDDEPRIHKAWNARQLEHVDFTPQVARAVLPAARDGWRESEDLRAFVAAERAEQSRRQAEAQREAIGNIAELEQQLAAVRASATAGNQVDDAALQELQDRLGRAASERQTVAKDLDDAYEEIERVEARADATQSELDEAKAENFRLKARVEVLEVARAASAAEDVSQLSADEQFAVEVRALHARTFTAQDDDKVLLPFTVREGFLSSVAKAGADPEKVKETAMQVACGIATSLDSRRVHRLRAGDGGNDAARTRLRDGAVAHRCNIQTKAAAARRLHYWVAPGNELEFVSLVTHDDFSIAE